MAVVIVTGSCGLIGSESAAHYAARGFDVVGIDNDLRQHFFGDAASTVWVRARLEASWPRYRHEALDVRDRDAIEALLKRYGADVALVVHAAAQPSHDWAATDPHLDFGVNAVGTLTLLDAVRRFCPETPFVYLSTNKVYGDLPNALPLVELETRWELPADHSRHGGIDESMSIDGSTHSLFGVSKAAGDLLVQEYGRYFGLRTACLRGGCLSGPNHSGAMLHGFLAYLMKCVCTGTPYTVFGHKGKQVRDNIHSADLIAAIDAIFASPRSGEVYNMGGGRRSNCSMIEAIALCEEIAGRPLSWSYRDEPRIGDHIWYISDLSRFQAHYPGWQPRYSLRALVEDIYQQNVERWAAAGPAA